MKNHDSCIKLACMCSTTRFVRYFSEHKVARVKVLNDDQWRLPMDSKHSSVTPTTESNLSSSTEEIQP